MIENSELPLALPIEVFIKVVSEESQRLILLKGQHSKLCVKKAILTDSTVTFGRCNKVNGMGIKHMSKDTTDFMRHVCAWMRDKLDKGSLKDRREGMQLQVQK